MVAADTVCPGEVVVLLGLNFSFTLPSLAAFFGFSSRIDVGNFLFTSLSQPEP